MLKNISFIFLQQSSSSKIPKSASTWIEKARLPCWLPRGQQVSHQRRIWGINCTEARKHESKGSTLALKPRVDATRSPKQGYQWLHKKDLCPSKIWKKRVRCPKYIYFTFWIQSLSCPSPFTFENNRCLLDVPNMVCLHITDSEEGSGIYARNIDDYYNKSVQSWHQSPLRSTWKIGKKDKIGHYSLII